MLAGARRPNALLHFEFEPLILHALRQVFADAPLGPQSQSRPCDFTFDQDQFSHKLFAWSRKLLHGFVSVRGDHP